MGILHKVTYLVSEPRLWDWFLTPFCTASWGYLFFFFFPPKEITSFIYLFFFFGYARSFLLLVGFLYLQQVGATLHCGVQASH